MVSNIGASLAANMNSAMRCCRGLHPAAPLARACRRRTHTHKHCVHVDRGVMIGSQRKLQAVREGAELRAALATAFASTTPHGFDNVLLNRLLEYAKLPRDHPKKDPLELKQTLTAVDPGLGKLL